MYSLRCQWMLRSIFAFNGSSAKISTTGICGNEASLYEVLGIDQKSTQSEIKSAYYKLSMQYHPDKNHGCEDSLKKFQLINHAYEVLSNYKSRRLYDKGGVHTSGTYAHTHAEEMVEDDPETKFYKSRFKRSTVADAQGRTPIYDFDEWSRNHYGKSFERRKTAKEKFETKVRQNHANTMSSQNEILLLGLTFCAVAVYLMFIAESSYDTPKNTKEAKLKEAESNTKS